MIRDQQNWCDSIYTVLLVLDKLFYPVEGSAFSVVQILYAHANKC